MSLTRENFLPNGLEPKTISDIFEIRKQLFDPDLNSTSSRIENGQLNPGHPEDCWTANTFEDTLIPLYSSDSDYLPVQPCANCQVNFICYSNIFSTPENPNADISQALITIDNLSRK